MRDDSHARRRSGERDAARPDAPALTVVADDHPLYRAALASVVRSDPGLALAGSATDGRTAYALILRVRAEVAVLDVRMPDWGGLTVARRLHREGQATRILLLTEHEHLDSELVLGALTVGVTGLLTKGATAEEVRAAIHTVAAGRQAVGPEAATILTEHARSAGPRLTAREQEVLQLVAGGLTAPEIADVLVVALPTVKSHLQHVYFKLGVRGKGAAVAEGMRRGLVR